MAGNISDDGSAPVDFNLSSTIEDENKVSSMRKKCLLCCSLRKTFYCNVCIRNGDFVSSTPQHPERFADKKLRLFKLKSDKQDSAKKCLKMIEKKNSKVTLQTEIKDCRDRIKLLKQLLNRKKEAIKKTNKELETIKEKNKARVTRLPRYKERVEKLQYYVTNNMKIEIVEKKERVATIKLELRKIVQKNVQDLVLYIFPIYKIDPISKSEDESESTDTVSALAEATRTSYIRGKWIFMDSSGELHYRIVAPTLPGSGDYSAYTVWVAANKNGVPDNEKMEQNQAYNISAALCYTTQLVNLLAFYLDVILPKKVNYSDFNSTEISDSKFYKKISKLNTNILYLCFSQGVDTSLLNPKHTLCNILHLVSHPDLGRDEPFEIDSNLISSLENFDAVPKTDEGSEEDENDVVPSEWEAIPLVPCPESLPGSAPFASQHMSNVQATTSMAGGLVTSLASMLRGWTGNR